MALNIRKLFSVVGTLGPMARDPDSIVTAMRAIWDGSMIALDPSVVPMTFNEDMYQSKQRLRIGYYCDMGRIPACYTAHRAVNMAKEHLQSLGHEVATSDYFVVQYSQSLAGLACVVFPLKTK